MKRLLLVTGLALLVSCEGIVPDDDDNNRRTRVPTDPEELAVWNAVYDDEYKYPDGFYSEPGDWTTSINYMGRGVTENGKTFYKQYSTDSRDQAREWWYAMQADNTNPQTIAEESETDRYFEFISISKTSEITHTSRWRYHKSSYFTPTDMIFSTPRYPEFYKPYTIGIYGGPLSAGAVEELIESLWYFETRQWGGYKVLSTDYKETSFGFVYTVISTEVTYGDWGLHDEIRVYESTLELDKHTRELRSTDCILLKTIQGRYISMGW